MSKETPKKVSTRTKSRKVSVDNVNDLFRLCKCVLGLKYGTIEKRSYISTENLFKSSRKKGKVSDETLAELCWLDLVVEVSSSTELSDRVCKPCGQKIRNASELTAVIKQDINAVPKLNEDTVVKRQLPTTVLSPKRSPVAKKAFRSSKT